MHKASPPRSGLMTIDKHCSHMHACLQQRMIPSPLYLLNNTRPLEKQFSIVYLKTLLFLLLHAPAR